MTLSGGSVSRIVNALPLRYDQILLSVPPFCSPGETLNMQIRVLSLNSGTKSVDITVDESTKYSTEPKVRLRSSSKYTGTYQRSA